MGRPARSPSRTTRKLLALSGLDAVLIATPDHWQKDFVIDALNAGKDVYVEKPLTRRGEEGPEIVRAARVNNRVCQVGMQQRSGEIYLEARERFVQSGKIGKISHVECVWHKRSRLAEAPAATRNNCAPDPAHYIRSCGMVDSMDWHSKVRFPGESARYRTARDKLLLAERGLRKQVEQVARLRRELPLGGAIAQDYVFEEGAAQPVRLSELFREGCDTLALYSFMFGPAMKQPCPMCTSFLDSLNGTAPHATQRINLAVVAKSPIGRIREFAGGRGWNNLRLLSSAGNTYNHDYHGETEDGGQLPLLNVFLSRKGKIHHFYATELLFSPPARGQNERHIDMMWPLWNLLDMTPAGRGTDWFPRLSY
jgi:predicted dithiol-disulfide oxidoreductase (DUF899 family)